MTEKVDAVRTRESDWVVRDALPEDEPCLVSMWLKGFAHSREVRDAGFGEANVDGSPDEIAYWRVHQPIVTALLAAGRVRVACPPGRAQYTDAGPAVIAAWTCMTPGLVHWIGIKRAYAKLEGGDVARELLAELLEGADGTLVATFDLLDAKKLGALEGICRDRMWLSALREVSRRALERDEVFGGVVDRIMRSEAWMPSSERAA